MPAAPPWSPVAPAGPDAAGPSDAADPPDATRRRSTPDGLLLRLEWKVLRRVEGRLQGAYRTAQRGTGLDLTGLRTYVEGDDARHIDWNVTARTDEPYVRQYTEDRELTVWLVLDRSASMRAGVLGHGKDDRLAELALALARLFGRGGNRVGAVLYDTGAVRVVRPGTGRAQALQIGAALERTGILGTGGGGPAGAPPDGPTDGPTGGPTDGRDGRRAARRRRRAASAPDPSATTDLAAMLESVASVAPRRSLVLLVSDFIGTGDWERPLLRLVHRHEVVALHVVDPCDDALPEAGLVVVEDAETGEQLVVDSGDPLFRSRFLAAVEARDAALSHGMRRAGVPVHRVGTDRSLVDVLVEIVTDTRERRA